MRDSRFQTLKPLEEELVFNPVRDIAEECRKLQKKAKGAAWTQALKDFSKLDKNVMLNQKVFELPYDSKGGSVVWEIKESDVQFLLRPAFYKVNHNFSFKQLLHSFRNTHLNRSYRLSSKVDPVISLSPDKNWYCAVLEHEDETIMIW